MDNTLTTPIADGDVDDEVIECDLNESNLSTKPLQSSWNYRRPIVGPNG